MPLSSTNTHISAVWVSVEDIIRPAYQPAPTKPLTARDSDGSALGAYQDWFNSNRLSSYFSSRGQYPRTRPGYTYNWGAEDEYGLTEFLVLPNATIEVEFTKSVYGFLNWLRQKNGRTERGRTERDDGRRHRVQRRGCNAILPVAYGLYQRNNSGIIS